MSKNKIVLDATVLSSLMSCARKTNNRFNLNLIPSSGKSNALECGSLVHFILEHFNKALIAGAKRTDAIDVGFAAGREYIDGYKPTNKYLLDKSELELKNTPEDGDSKTIGWSFVFDTMRQYFDYWRNDNQVVLAAEETRGVLIYEDDDIAIFWKAKFDCILDTNIGMLSRDYKTMRQRNNTVSINNQFMGQCIVLKSRNIIIDKIGFQKSLKPEERFERAVISYSADRLSEFAYDVVPYYARMLVIYNESGIWPPNFTQCQNKFGTCEYIKVCEHDRNMRDEILKHDFIEGKVWDINND